MWVPRVPSLSTSFLLASVIACLYRVSLSQLQLGEVESEHMIMTGEVGAQPGSPICWRGWHMPVMSLNKLLSVLSLMLYPLSLKIKIIGIN